MGSWRRLPRMQVAPARLALAAAELPAAGPAHADHGVAAPADLRVPAGGSMAGSTARERELAHRLDEAAYGDSVTREQGWHEKRVQP